MKKYDVSQPLFQALLDHFWAARESGAPRSVGVFPDGYCITYRQLAEKARVDYPPKSLGGPLFEIADFCWETYGVPLHALVVTKATGFPGGLLDEAANGYKGAAGSSQTLEGWEKIDVPSCIAATTLPKIAPPLP